MPRISEIDYPNQYSELKHLEYDLYNEEDIQDYEQELKDLEYLNWYLNS